MYSGSASSSSSSSYGWTYDVFLSFRGEDTRKNFTDHLYANLVNAGIQTFRDDEELPRGQEISQRLLKAIQESRISIVVFSKGYASSAWCLNELVQIMECKNTIGQIVLPVFYDIDPSNVRKQKRSFEEAFAMHEIRFKEEMERVNKWRKALKEAADLSGFAPNMVNRCESKLTQMIVEHVLNKLEPRHLRVAKHPVGIDSKVDYIIDLLSIDDDKDVCFLGVYGMPGIGKTSIAMAIFNRLRDGFDGCCFLSNVKEKSKKDGLIQLQKQLLRDTLNSNITFTICDEYIGINLIKERLCRRRLLLVVDDVDEFNQLEALAGEQSWFGSGSRVIITTRNEHLLTQFEVYKKFKVEELDKDESLELFSWHAFRDTHPSEDWLELSNGVMMYCGGVPLALEVLGSYLSKRTKIQWESEIERLQKIPHDDIQKKLQLSFDALANDVKNVFLDISCFFIGGDTEYVAKILHGRCGFNPEIIIATLIERSLLTIDKDHNFVMEKKEKHGRLMMHDLIRDMGREIVRQISPQHPGKRSRIWLYVDALDVLKKRTGTEVVEGLALDVCGSKAVPFSTRSFTNMSYLKLLQINGIHLIGSHDYLPKDLVWLCWLGCPLNSLPSNFQLDNITVLDMQYSNLRELWKETKALNNLKILNLSHSKYLAKTPNFLGFSNLEKLILEDCPSLIEIHQSIGYLSKLVFLNLEGCCRLRNLPESIRNLESLKDLNLNMCSKLEKLPDCLGDMESLTVLLADETAITQLPSSIGNLKCLKKLSVNGYNNGLDSPSGASWLSLLPSWVSPRTSSSKSFLPSSFYGLTSLVSLKLGYRGLSESDIFGIVLGNLYSLQILDLRGNKFSNLPFGIGRLPKLGFLRVSECNNLQSISEIPSSLKQLVADDCTSMKSMPSKEGLFLSVRRCRNLIEIQGFEAGPRSLDFKLADCDNLSDNCKKIIVQACGEDYDIVVVGGEIPEWFSYHGEGSSVCFQIPNTVSDGKLQALAVWIVCTGNEVEEFLSRSVSTTIKNKTSGDKLLRRRTYVLFNKNYGKHSWVTYMTLAGHSLRMEGGDVLELHVEVFGGGIEVERCGVHLIVKEAHAAAEVVSLLGCTEAQWKSYLTREFLLCQQICFASSYCHLVYLTGLDRYVWDKPDGESNPWRRVKSPRNRILEWDGSQSRWGGFCTHPFLWEELRDGKGGCY